MALKHSDPKFKEKLAVHNALGCLKWYEWKNKILAAIEKDHPDQFMFPCDNDWTMNVVRTFKLFFPVEYETYHGERHPLGETLTYIEKFIYAEE